MIELNTNSCSMAGYRNKAVSYLCPPSWAATGEHSDWLSWHYYWPYSVIQRSATCLMSLYVIWFVWLHAGAMLVERFVDNRLLLMWSHPSISQAATRRYRRQVEDIKTAHRDLANLFLETWLTGRPLYHFDLHEWSGDHDVTQLVLDVGRRYVGAQPLLLSKSSYNLRRLSELWYQLLNAG